MHELWVRNKHKENVSEEFIKDLEMAKDENLINEHKLTSSDLW